MKTVLCALNATRSHSNLAIRCLADALSEHGFSSTLVEATLKDRTHTVLARLFAERAEVYGFSCYIWNIEESLRLAEQLKALLPHCRIVLGGPEVSFDTERFEALPFVDTIITGEGEEAIVTLLSLWETGGSAPRVLHGTPDSSFSRAGIHYEVDQPISPLVYYESSRGCPFSCAFCLSSATAGVRAKPAEMALFDLLEFEKFKQPLTVKLVDRTFNFDLPRAKAIWRGLADARYTKCYHFEIAAHLLDEECFEILSAFPAGKIRLEIGLQSTNEKTLSAIARHTDAARVLAASRRLAEMGNLHVHLDLIAGLPHEDYASFARSFDAAYFACDGLQLGFLKLLHGTRLRAEADRYGVICDTRPPYTVLQTPDCSFEELERLHAVSDLMERLRDSGRFARTLSFLLPHYFTPFAFYEGFSAYLARMAGVSVQQIPQRDLFLLLSEFAKPLIAADAAAELSQHLRADFAACEVRRPPHGL